MRASSAKNIVSIAICALLAGCSMLLAPTETGVDIGTIDPTPSVAALTHMCTSYPTIMRHPPQTRVPTMSPVPTWTPGPRLSLEEQREILDELLATNGGCEMPCWWGITPEETTWEEMRVFFHERDVPIRTEDNGSTLYATFDLNGTNYPAWGDGSITFWGRRGFVQSVQVTGRVAEGSSVQHMTLFSPNEYLAQFSLARVLSTYGVPSQVYVSGLDSYTFGPYYLLVEYAGLGMLFGYSGYTVGNTIEYLVCPAGNGVNEIELWLQSPGNTFSDVVELSSAMTYSRWYWEDPGRVLEEMSAEEFYETFRHAESLDCLRILGDGYREIARPASLSPVFTVEEDALLVEMLQTNGGCDLPCWWGITPGATSVQDAQQVFLAYGKPVGIPWWSSDQPRYLVGAFGQHIPVLFDYVVEHEFSAEGDIVSCLRVVGEPPVWASYSQRLNSDWQRYSLSAVLTRLGSPSQVSVFHDHPTCGDAYQLRVLYDDLGIKISYDGVVNREAGTVTICPAAGGFVGIRMTLFSPALIADEELEREHGAYGDLDSDIDPEIFYQTFVDSNTQTCLEFPEQTEYTCP